MPISTSDIQELKRIATNTYDEDKKFILRVIKNISETENDNLRLKNEISTLKTQIKKLSLRTENQEPEFDRYSGG